MNLFKTLTNKLSKTREKLGDRIKAVIMSHGKISDELYDDLEETLLTSDVGVDATREILDGLREKVRQNGRSVEPSAVQDMLTEVITQTISPEASEKELNVSSRPSVILVVGVNGSGKTTSIAKLAHFYQEKGLKVMLAAADTFRAAATEQLQEWGRRLDVTVVHQQIGADPAAVAFDAFQSARAKNYDMLIVDTAGRLHNKANLMQELAKIARVLKKINPDAPHEVFLVLDATTGQNALQQAKVFQEICGVTGLILSKLDGTAKGGAVISICRELEIPLRFIGIGEKLSDLEPFEPSAFAEAIVSSTEDPN
ncbi:signal recognition particle-docking protein FtsY [candidate division LCP-89 bacterium B3_LCP]|uniref:Signal recognition particle receptor FtsY n=1 Tax=candidate division LCP-89 bacterium B3_LCP TaxID=2012998 RepID=A0A532V236_UNCL8|nr:MAG: signal recognition particle-docking protein FtsY [candidate division LCP-89 bacterium B3_LCP]